MFDPHAHAWIADMRGVARPADVRAGDPEQLWLLWLDQRRKDEVAALEALWKLPPPQ